MRQSSVVIFLDMISPSLVCIYPLIVLDTYNLKVWRDVVPIGQTNEERCNHWDKPEHNQGKEWEEKVKEEAL